MGLILFRGSEEPSEINVWVQFRVSFAFTLLRKNPAYGRHQLSRPMRIVGPKQFLRGCVIYWSAPKSGLGPRKNADLVHAKVETRSTQKCWLGSLRNTSPFLGLYSRLRSNSEHILVFKALLEIEIKIKIKLRNTSSFLGLYSRSRSRSRSNQDRTPEYILIFTALLEIETEITIEIKLRNTSLFLGLYSRSRLRSISRSNSGTHPRF